MIYFFDELPGGDNDFGRNIEAVDDTSKNLMFTCCR